MRSPGNLNVAGRSRTAATSAHFAGLSALATLMLTACGGKCPPGTVEQGAFCRSKSALTADAAVTDAGAPGSSGTGAGSPAAAGSGGMGGTGAGGSGGSGSPQSMGGSSAANAATGATSGSGGANPATGSGGSMTAGRMGSGTAGTDGAAGVNSQAAPICGNGKVESGETCDGNCPTQQTCTAPDPCLKPMLVGAAASCTAECTTMPITKCAADDQCCPDGCTSVNDSDCSPSCGNKTMEQGETCDPPASCPTTCDDGDPCTTDMKTGSPAQCNIKCSHMPVVAPKNGDGCCPHDANANNDNDCSAKCGNGVTENGETCDPPGSCPTSCDDGDPCTMDPMAGSASNCTAVCGPKVAVPAQSASDKCCPRNATLKDDPDCPAPSGWTVVEAGSCSGSGALQLHAGATVDCNPGACSCSAPPKNNCQGGIAGLSTDVFVKDTSCGAQIGTATSANIELAMITSMPDSNGCTAVGNGQGTVSFSSMETYCPVSTPRTSSCITKAGDATCPAGYGSRKLLYKSYTGGSCMCGGCGIASPGACNDWRYATGGCGSGVSSAGAFEEKALIGVDLNTLRVWVNETPGTCKAASSQANNDITVTGPQTICCP
jgi:hypothetical protein